MQNILPFQSILPTTLSLRGDLQRAGSKLVLIFEVIDSAGVLELPKAFCFDAHQVPRENELWNETCFEMFLRPQNETLYYEFNFSLKPAWNEYLFTDYRSPQPPQAANDIALKSMHWDGRLLKLELAGVNTNSNFDVSLNAVLKEKSGIKHYMALAHNGEKADFHLAKNFILKR
ncbi:MAG: hypothetical protein H7328_03555 [Bdellovibrio sp.]|nr:hypothetical protein [Bdellovibrio sp.]